MSGGFRKRFITLLAVSLAISFVSACAALSGPPRNDRAWYPYLSRTSQVGLDTERFQVKPVLDWSYDSAGETAETLDAADYALSDLRDVWFVLEPQPGSKLAAHTFLIFEFTGDRLLGVTIEARRETHKDYSAIAGLFNKYELAYVWGSARDLLTRRAVMLNHDVFMYPLALKPEWKHDLLTRMLQRTKDLETTPRYYNTLTSNCTNEIAKATDLKWDRSFILTGLADEHLYKLKLIPGPSFDEAHERSTISPFVRDLNAAPKQEFDARLLAELRRRGTT